jgi:hypothetical protein
MAKKIIISFNSQPVLGVAFGYNILIDNVKLVYNSGVDFINASYANTAVIPQVLKLQPTLAENIANTLFTLNSFFQSNAVTYAVEGNSIIVLVNNDTAIIQQNNGVNPSITFTILDIPIDTLGLKYYLEYVNIIGDKYLCNIFKKNYTGLSSEIFGSISIEKGTAKDHLDPIRGTGLTLELEANKDLTLEDLYTDNEQDYTVQLYKNNAINFAGYLKPDGVFQDFVRDEWRLSLECIDGLGALKNLSFVDTDGFQFRGKYTALDIIYNCLKRSGILLNINTSINILYDGLAAENNTDILDKIYLSTERYFKVDGKTQGTGTITSCEDVLKSILDVFCAVITQKDGEWYIYKPNEIYTNSNILFRRYNTDNNFVGIKNVNINRVLGSQIDNHYPHHSGGNQRIEIKGANSAFRIGYKYGFLNGLLGNKDFIHNANDYTPWQILSPGYVIYDPSVNFGLRVDGIFNLLPRLLVAKSENVPLNIGDSFDFDVNVTAVNDVLDFIFRITLGNYYLDFRGEWTLTPNFLTYRVGQNSLPNQIVRGTESFSVSSLPLPISGNVNVEIYAPRRLDGFLNSYGIINSLDIINTFQGNNIVGEFHTVERSVKISTLVKDNKEVLNGDNDGIVYNGAIFKDDQITLTTSWNRRGIIGNYRLLQISAEEELRISQKPTKIFTGDAYGYIDYLSLININNVGTKFMPIEWSYDTKTNVTKMKSLELFVDEIADIDYKYTLDYGETVKPTIKG